MGGSPIRFKSEAEGRPKHQFGPKIMTWLEHSGFSQLVIFIKLGMDELLSLPYVFIFSLVSGISMKAIVIEFKDNQFY